MLSSADRSNFARHGFVVLPGVLSGPEAAEMRATFDLLELAPGVRSANERVLLRHQPFLRVLGNKMLLDSVELLLGEDMQLLALDSLETRPNMGPGPDGASVAWHVDFAGLVPSTVCINVGIYLQDMTSDMGPLQVVPGSHRWGKLPTSDEVGTIRQDAVAVPVGAGDAVMFDAQIWHTGSRNAGTIPRRAVFAYFGHYWIKRMDEFARVNLPSSITESLDGRLRQLFGLGLQSVSVHGSDYRSDNPRWF